jgi:crotonobetainyl-CoA:carnitine CoA-transferase CaiB-like acyl-CoA transferase
MLDEWFSDHTRQELYELLQSRGVPCFPVYSVAELMAAPQYVERGVIVEQHHPIAGAIRQPGPSIRYSKTPWALRRPAPLFGEHTEEVLGEIAGLGAAEIAVASGQVFPSPAPVEG